MKSVSKQSGTKTAPKSKKATPARPPQADRASAMPGSNEAELDALPERRAELSSDEVAFLHEPRSNDPLVQHFGEAFVHQAGSGEYEEDELIDGDVPEDNGGPFVITSKKTEFAMGTDESNPKDALREPFPIATAQHGRG